mgnify:CR=1 FL=1
MRIALALIVPVVAACVAEAACVAVEGESITVADVARADAQFAAAQQDAVVAPAPAPGARRILAAGQLAALAARLGITYERGAAACFERRTERLTRERLLEAVRAAVADASDAIEVIDFSRTLVPAGQIELTPSRSELWRGRVRYGRNHTVPIWVRVRGALAVERGELVDVTAESGDARVSIPARAESGGRPGDVITVRREDNQRRLRARVTAKGKVEIDANSTAGGGDRAGIGGGDSGGGAR